MDGFWPLPNPLHTGQETHLTVIRALRDSSRENKHVFSFVAEIATDKATFQSGDKM